MRSGLDSLLSSDEGEAKPNAGVGNLLVVLAQVVVAVQMIVEEYFVGGLDVPPLLAVGCEGVFGVLLLTGVMTLTYHLDGIKDLSQTTDHLDDALDGVVQVFAGGNGWLTFWIVMVVLSIACFNFFGISVTKELSAAHRMVLDSSRSIVVWVFSLTASEPGAGPQAFAPTQLVGFLVLILGSLVYYELLSAERALRKVNEALRGPRAMRTAPIADGGMGRMGGMPADTAPTLDAALLPAHSVQSDAPPKNHV